MLVKFKFWRMGYYAEGLVEQPNLDQAAERLWKEHPQTFKWIALEKDNKDNRLTVEEWQDENTSSIAGSKAKA